MKRSLRGFFFLPVVATLLLLQTAASLSLQRAMRLQTVTHDTEWATHLGSSDLHQQKTAAVHLADELIQIIQGEHAPLQRLIPSHLPLENGTLASTAFGDLSTLLDVSDWHPDRSLYQLISLPDHLCNFTGSAAVVPARMARLSYKRDAERRDPLRPRGALRKASDERTFVVYEIPHSSAVAGRRVRIGPHPINGSVNVRDLELDADSVISGRLTVWRRLRAAAGARVSGKTISQDMDSLIDSKLFRQAQTGELTGGHPFENGEISLIRSNEWAAWLDLGNRSPNAEGICTLLLPGSSPTPWDAYTRPYYACAVKVVARLENASSVRVSIHSTRTDTLNARLATPTGATEFTLIKGGPSQAGISFRQSLSGERLLRLDMSAIGTRTLYVDFTSNTGQRLNNDLFVTFQNAQDLTHLGSFSLVTPNRVLLRGEINTKSSIPLSILASELRYGYGHLAAKATIGGQLASIGDGERLNCSTLPTSGGTMSVVQGLQLSDISDPAALPPIVPRSWLIAIENPHDSNL